MNKLSLNDQWRPPAYSRQTVQKYPELFDLLQIRTFDNVQCTHMKHDLGGSLQCSRQAIWWIPVYSQSHRLCDVHAPDHYRSEVQDFWTGIRYHFVLKSLKTAQKVFL